MTTRHRLAHLTAHYAEGTSDVALMAGGTDVALELVHVLDRALDRTEVLLDVPEAVSAEVAGVMLGLSSALNRAIRRLDELGSHAPDGPVPVVTVVER